MHIIGAYSKKKFIKPHPKQFSKLCTHCGHESVEKIHKLCSHKFHFDLYFERIVPINAFLIALSCCLNDYVNFTHFQALFFPMIQL